MAAGLRRPTLPLVDRSARSWTRPPRGDVLLAVGFLAVSLVQVAVAPIAAPAVAVLVAVVSTVPLAWRRACPSAAALVGTAVWLIPTPGGYLLLGYVVAVLLFYSLGAHDPVRWRVVTVTAVAVLISVVGTLLGPDVWQASIGAALAVAAPAVAGVLVAEHRAQNARLRELTAQLVHERAAAERAAAAEERTRIARELHDVIGHEITVIALQADAAAAALARAPERAAVPVDRIRAAAARTLTEMRRVGGLLRDPDEDGGEPPGPSPGGAGGWGWCGPPGGKGGGGGRSPDWGESPGWVGGPAPRAPPSTCGSPSPPSRRRRACSSPPSGSSRRRSPTPAGA